MMVPQTDRQNWDVLVDSAKRFLVPPLTDMHASAKMLQIRQGNTESVADYVLRLNRYARIAWQNMAVDELVMDKLKLTAFLVGLRADLKQRVPACQKTFMRAVDKARSAEGEYPGEATPAFLEPSTKSGETPAALSGAIATLASVAESLSTKINQQNESQKVVQSMPQTNAQHSSNPEMRCFNCHRAGHSRATCRAPGGGAYVDRSQVSNNQSNGNQNGQSNGNQNGQNNGNQNFQNNGNQNQQYQNRNQNQNFHNNGGQNSQPNRQNSNQSNNANHTPLGNGPNNRYGNGNGGSNSNNNGRSGKIYNRVSGAPAASHSINRENVYVPPCVRNDYCPRFASAICVGEGYNDPPAPNTTWVQREIGGAEFMCQDPNCHTCTLRRKITPLKKAKNARERRQIMRANQAVDRCSSCLSSSSCDKSRSYLAETEKQTAPPPDWIFKFRLGVRYPWRPNSQVALGPPRYILDPRKLRKAGLLMENACCVNEPPKPGVVEVPFSLDQKVAAMNLASKEKFWEQGEFSGTKETKSISESYEPQTGSEIDSENLESISQVLEKRRESEMKKEMFASPRKSRKFITSRISSSSNDSIVEQKSEIRIQPALTAPKKYSNVFMLFVGMIFGKPFFSRHGLFY